MRDLIRIVERAQGPRAPDTPEFRRWFAGSKVVDASGEPLVVYHGTAASKPFDRFDPEAGGIGLTFFSTDPTMSSAYAGERGHVIPCVLRILKPYDHRTADNERIATAFFDAMADSEDGVMNSHSIKIGLYGREDVEDDDNPDITDEHITLDEFVEALNRGLYPAIEDPDFLRFLRSHGCDGVTTYEMNAVNWAVFDSSQAKSVFARAFDPNRGNIGEDVSIEHTDDDW